MLKDGEAWLHNSYIPQYSHSIAASDDYDPYRSRKLLLTQHELKQISEFKEKFNYSVIALKIFLSKNNYAKLVFGVGKGRRKYDKREHLKKQQVEREMEKFTGRKLGK